MAWVAGAIYKKKGRKNYNWPVSIDPVKGHGRLELMHRDQRNMFA
jgi:hypothetical protein